MKPITLLLLLALMIASPALAQQDGWERNSRYNHFFNSKSIVYVTGKVTHVHGSHVPLHGMTKGFALTVKDADGKEHFVEVGPVWFSHFYKKKWDIAIGDTVDVRGSKTEIDGKPVIMAVWGRKGDLAMTLRSPKGAPVWDLEISDFDF